MCQNKNKPPLVGLSTYFLLIYCNSLENYIKIFVYCNRVGQSKTILFETKIVVAIISNKLNDNKPTTYFHFPLKNLVDFILIFSAANAVDLF
jgi:hypothetical protein